MLGHPYEYVLRPIGTEQPKPLPVDIHHRPHFDGSCSRVRNACGPVDGGIERLHVNQEGASEECVGVHSRPTGHASRCQRVQGRPRRLVKVNLGSGVPEHSPRWAPSACRPTGQLTGTDDFRAAVASGALATGHRRRGQASARPGTGAFPSQARSPDDPRQGGLITRPTASTWSPAPPPEAGSSSCGTGGTAEPSFSPPKVVMALPEVVSSGSRCRQRHP